MPSFSITSVSHRVIFSLLATCAALVLSGCGNDAVDVSGAEKVIRENSEAMEREDIKGVIATIHPQMPGYELQEALLDRMFSQIKLHYVTEKVEFESRDKDTLRMRFVQRLEKIEGPDEFVDQRVSGVHILKQHQGKWLIFNTESRSTEPYKKP